MKRLLLLLIILSSASYAQEERFSISSHFGYSLSRKMLNKETNFRSTFNAGIEVRTRIGEKGLFLQTGLRWNEFGHRLIYEAYDWNGEYWMLEDLDYKSTYFYLSIPLIATYKFKKMLPGLTLSAGPQLSIYMFRKLKSNNVLVATTNQPDFLNLSAYFSVGYERNVGERWILGGELYSNSIIPLASYNFGLGISGRYILK